MPATWGTDLNQRPLQELGTAVEINRTKQTESTLQSIYFDALLLGTRKSCQSHEGGGGGAAAGPGPCMRHPPAPPPPPPGF